MSRLNSVDFPTFGRPTIATPGIVGSLGALGFDFLVGEVLDDRVEEVTGAEAMERGQRERLPEPERDEWPDLVTAAVAVDLVGGDEHRSSRPVAATPRPPRPLR